MYRSAALPFLLRRSHDDIGVLEITSTTEKILGLLRLEADRLLIQWRLARSTDRVGMAIRTEHEIEPVQEAAIPLAALAGATVRWLWWRWLPGPYLVLTAADLRAFEEIAGTAALRLAHPAELAVRVRRSDRTAAVEFASYLELAVAEHALRAAEEEGSLPPPVPGGANRLPAASPAPRSADAIP
jgi:hypothetical protein